MLRRIILLGLLISLLWATAGCNTLRGAGQDLQRLGEEIEDVFD